MMCTQWLGVAENCCSYLIGSMQVTRALEFCESHVARPMVHRILSDMTARGLKPTQDIYKGECPTVSEFSCVDSCCNLCFVSASWIGTLVNFFTLLCLLSGRNCSRAARRRQGHRAAVRQVCRQPVKFCCKYVACALDVRTKRCVRFLPSGRLLFAFYPPTSLTNEQTYLLCICVLQHARGRDREVT